MYIVSIYRLLFPVNLGNVIAAAYKSDKKNPFVSLSDHEMLEKYRVKSFEVQGNNSRSTLSALRFRKFRSFIWQSRRCYILKLGGGGGIDGALLDQIQRLIYKSDKKSCGPWMMELFI